MLSLILGLLGSAAVRSRANGGTGVPAVAGVVFGVFAFAAALLSLLLLLLWTVTNHTFAHRNENLLLFNPLWLVLFVAGPMLLARGRAAWSSAVAWGAVILAVIGLALHAVGASRQDNLPLFALALPPFTVFALILQRSRMTPGVRRGS